MVRLKETPPAVRQHCNPRANHCKGVAVKKHTCSIEGCQKKRRTRGFCDTHYARWLKHGDPMVGARPEYPPTCTLEGCDRKYYGNGLCALHYRRVRDTGSTEITDPRYSAPKEFFDSRINVDGDCVVWSGTINPNGYGYMGISGKRVRVHRYAWELANGPVPDGMMIDHICHNRACVKVEHLRLADRVENGRNREGANARSSTGVRNVHRRHNGTFRVIFGIDNKNVYFGTYPTLDEAARVADEKRAELFGEFAGGGR